MPLPPRILPVNDRPELLLAPAYSSLRPAAGSTTPLPPDLVSVTDPDTAADQMVIVVSYNDSRYSKLCSLVHRWLLPFEKLAFGNSYIVTFTEFNLGKRNEYESSL